MVEANGFALANYGQLIYKFHIFCTLRRTRTLTKTSVVFRAIHYTIKAFLHGEGWRRTITLSTIVLTYSLKFSSALGFGWFAFVTPTRLELVTPTLEPLMGLAPMPHPIPECFHCSNSNGLIRYGESLLIKCGALPTELRGPSIFLAKYHFFISGVRIDVLQSIFYFTLLFRLGGLTLFQWTFLVGCGGFEPSYREANTSIC